MFWNYEQYTKAIVPLVLGLGRLFQGWIESGTLSRAEASDVVGLVVVALLVFLVPNTKRERKRKAPEAQQKPKRSIADEMRRGR